MRAVKTSLKKEGFEGRLYFPDQDRFPGRVLIIAGGGDGIYTITKRTAELFTRHGITTFALAYWNRKGMPKKFINIPLDTVEKTAVWLRKKGYTKIGMWGISKGAEYALLCGSILTDLIDAVVAVSPPCVCLQGFRMLTIHNFSIGPLPYSSFSYHGKPLPYTRTAQDTKGVYQEAFKRKCFTMVPVYRNVRKDATEESRIKIEKIKGPVLLLAADDDDMYESRKYCEDMVFRAREKEFVNPLEFYHYRYGSHMLLPVCQGVRGIFKMARLHPEEYKKSCIDSFRKTMIFLKKYF